MTNDRIRISPFKFALEQSKRVKFGRAIPMRASETSSIYTEPVWSVGTTEKFKILPSDVVSTP